MAHSKRKHLARSDSSTWDNFVGGFRRLFIGDDAKVVRLVDPNDASAVSKEAERAAELQRIRIRRMIVAGVVGLLVCAVVVAALVFAGPAAGAAFAVGGAALASATVPAVLTPTIVGAIIIGGCASFGVAILCGVLGFFSDRIGSRLKKFFGGCVEGVEYIKPTSEAGSSVAGSTQAIASGLPVPPAAASGTGYGASSSDDEAGPVLSDDEDASAAAAPVSAPVSPSVARFHVVASRGANPNAPAHPKRAEPELRASLEYCGL